MRAAKIYDSIQYNAFKFKTLSLKYSASYDKDGSSQSFSGSIRIKKDSVIWISLTAALGIEAARVLITTDSITFINRLNSTFYKGDYSLLKNLLNLDIDFNSFQAIITNQFFLYPKASDAEDVIKTYKSDNDSTFYSIQSMRERKKNRKLRKNKIDDLVFHEVRVVPDIFKIAQVFIEDFESNKSLTLSYSNFADFENQKFPMNMEGVVKEKSKMYKIGIEFTKVTINKDMEYPFTVPESYKRLN